MGKSVLAILGLVVGLVLGTVFGGAALTGAAAGIGIATGLSAGICSTVIAAKEEAMLDDAQITQVLARAAQEISGTEAVTDTADLVGSVDECEQVMQKLKDAAAKE